MSLWTNIEDIRIDSNHTKPLLAFDNIEVFDAKDGILIQKLNAKTYHKYKKDDEAIDVNIEKFDKNIIYKLISKNIQNSDKKVLFEDNISLRMTNGLRLYGSNMMYEKDTNILRSNEKFILKNINYKLLGKSFIYDTKSNNFQAKKIKGTYGNL